MTSASRWRQSVEYKLEQQFQEGSVWWREQSGVQRRWWVPCSGSKGGSKSHRRRSVKQKKAYIGNTASWIVWEDKQWTKQIIWEGDWSIFEGKTHGYYGAVLNRENLWQRNITIGLILMHLQVIIILQRHTWYLSFFLHEQNFWRIKFTPKNANFSR